MKTLVQTATLLLLLALVVSCSATMLVAPGRQSGSQYAPVNEAVRPGMIKYLNQGADEVIRRRREDAYRQMYDACRGSYKIVSEGSRTEGGVAMSIGGIMVYDDLQYWYISFRCVPPCPRARSPHPSRSPQGPARAVTP